MSLRGHGESAGLERLKLTSLGDYVQDVLRVVSQMPIAPVLIGHSMGTLVVRRVAERVQIPALVLLAPVPAHGAWLSGWKQLRHTPLDLAKSIVTARTPERPEMLFQGLARDEGLALIHRMGPESPLVMTSLLQPRRFERPECPIAVFGAEQDRLVGRWDVRSVAADVGVQAEWLPETGHEMMLDASAENSIDAVLDWLDAHVGVE